MDLPKAYWRAPEYCHLNVTFGAAEAPLCVPRANVRVLAISVALPLIVSVVPAPVLTGLGDAVFLVDC